MRTMLAPSWRPPTDAPYPQPNLLGLETFRRLVAQTAFPPSLVWSTDAKTQEYVLATPVDASSCADQRLARQRAAGLHLSAAAGEELFGVLRDS